MSSYWTPRLYVHCSNCCECECQPGTIVESSSMLRSYFQRGVVCFFRSLQIVLLDQELIPYCYSLVSSFLLEHRSFKSLRRFKSDRDWIWQHCFSSKYPSIDRVDFWCDVVLWRWRLWRPPAARCCPLVRRARVTSLSRCMGALQFLIHSTFILILLLAN